MHNTLTLTRNPNHVLARKTGLLHTQPPPVFRGRLCFVFQVLAGGCVSCFSFGHRRLCLCFALGRGQATTVRYVYGYAEDYSQNRSYGHLHASNYLTIR